MHVTERVLKDGPNYYTWNGSPTTREAYDAYMAALEAEENPPAPKKTTTTRRKSVKKVEE